MQKARGHTENRRSEDHRAPTACKQTVSGTISLPSPGYFSPFPHGTGSLSVAKTYLALGDGPPKFPQGSTCPAVLGALIQRVRSAFTYRSITFYGQPFQVVQLTAGLVTLRAGRNPLQSDPTTPIMQRFRAITHDRFGLFPVRSPLLGKSLLFSSPEGTKMFQFPSFASYTYGFSV